MFDSDEVAELKEEIQRQGALDSTKSIGEPVKINGDGSAEWAGAVTAANNIITHTSLPPNFNSVITSTGTSVSGHGVTIYGQDDVVRVSIQDPVEDIVRDIRTHVNERIAALQEELRELSNRYEDRERKLQELSAKYDELTKCVEVFEPADDYGGDYPPKLV